MRIRFWGVRGSLPAPRESARRYGGHTCCLEVRVGNHLLILDAGSGIQELGHEVRADSNHLIAHLLLTHYHWDHVQGLPFFEPVYWAGNSLCIYGPRPQGGINLEGVFQALFRAPFFPVSVDQLHSASRLEELDWVNTFTLAGTRIRTCRLNHPQGSLAYRLEHGGAAVVYATDHEPGDPACDQAIRRLARGADVLISDAQYRPEELAQKTGWGHGSWESSVAIARDAGVNHLVLLHHDPFRSDEEIDQLVQEARRVFPHTWAASEGMIFDVTREKVEVRHGEEVEDPLRPNVGGNGLPVLAEPGLAFDFNGASNPGNGGGTAGQREASERGSLTRGEKRRQPGSVAVAELRLSADAHPTPTAVAVIPSNGSSAVEAPREETGDNGSQSRKRRYERVSLLGTQAYGVVKNGGDPKRVRVVDLSFNGVGFLIDEKPCLPEVFHARLHVPVLPDALLRMRRVYVHRVGKGLWRAGCRFSV